MKKMIVRAIGIMLITLGAMKAYACLRVVAVFVPIVFEHGLVSMGIHAGSLNLVMAAIGLAKAVGGVGLLWLKSWAKWTAAVAASLHILFLACFGIPIWIKMAQGTFENPAGIPMWKDYVTIGLNLVIVIALFILFKKPKNSRGTTTT